jgi:flagellar protein FlgJ
MDITALGAQYLNQEYVPFASSSANENSGYGKLGSFEEMLRKAQKPEVSAPVLNKPVIDKNDKLYELCQELETFLIKNLIKSMRSTVQKTKLIDTGFAGEVYEDMLYDEYAKAFSRNANLGFAEMAYRDLTRRS